MFSTWATRAAPTPAWPGRAYMRFSSPIVLLPSPPKGRRAAQPSNSPSLLRATKKPPRPPRVSLASKEERPLSPLMLSKVSDKSCSNCCASALSASTAVMMKFGAVVIAYVPLTAQFGEGGGHAAGRFRCIARLRLMLGHAAAVVAVATLFRFAAGLRRAIGQAHGQRDAFAFFIDFQHFHAHYLAGFHHRVWIFHEGARQGRDMYQAILVHADIDESAKRGHVGDHAFQDHVWAQVADFFHAFLEGGSGKFRTRIAARFFQLLQDIGNGWHAESVIGIFCRAEGFQQRCFTNHGLDVFLDIGQDFFH